MGKQNLFGFIHHSYADEIVKSISISSGLRIGQLYSKCCFTGPFPTLSSASAGQRSPAPVPEEQRELFHHEKNSVGLTVERKYGSSLTTPASFLHIPSFWDCAGSSHWRVNLPQSKQKIKSHRVLNSFRCTTCFLFHVTSIYRVNITHVCGLHDKIRF